MFGRMKEAFKNLRELYKNPNTHDKASLILWLIFIVILIVVLRVSSSSENISVEKEKKQIINSYEFTYNFENINISGLYYEEKILFYLNNNKYYNNDKTYIISGDEIKEIENFDLKALKISYEFISKAIENLTSTKEDNYSVYLVPLDTFISLYDEDVGEDISNAKNYNIIIKIKENNDLISSVAIDMSNYYIYKGMNVSYPVTIYFYNINNISDFTSEYENKIGVIK